MADGERHIVDPAVDAAVALRLSGDAHALFLVSHPDGRVDWANRAFCEFIGYTLPEFRRAERPVSWIDFTVPDESLEADRLNVAMMEAGEIAEYSVRKYYRPKAGSPQFVELQVLRHPISGPFQCCLVEVRPLMNGNAKMAQAYEALSRGLVGRLEAVSTDIRALTGEIEKSRDTAWRKASDWLAAHPKWGVLVLLLALGFVAGDRLFEMMERLMKIVPFGSGSGS